MTFAAPTPQPSTSPPTRRYAFPLLLALLLTALGSLKPMHIDETAYFYFARHIADHPLDPYGFDVFWYQWPAPANHVLAPPGLPYWWALGLRLFRPLGESVVLWKLWLLPFALLFVFSLEALFRRFCRGLEKPLLALTVLSPAVLPGLNLMPDIPALALSLGALVVFLRALDGDAPYVRALLAGLLAGLAMQTKYTGFLTAAVTLLAALQFGRPWLWLLVILPAVGIFVGWEALTARLYGESHFLFQLRSPRPLAEKALLALPLLTVTGGVAPAIGLLLLAARGASRQVLAAAGALVGIGYLVIAVLGARFGWDIPAGAAVLHFTLSDIIYGCWGVLLAGLLTTAAWRLGHPSAGERADGPSRRADRFLILWLVLEVAGYFFLTPFPAVRRILGLVIVATLLAGRLAARKGLSPDRVRGIRAIAAFGIVLGLGFLGVDVCDALAQKRAAETAAARLQKQGEGGQVWYVGHWGFQYYAERAGMEPVVPDVTRLRAGDWLVLPDEGIEQQQFVVDAERTQRAFHFAIDDRVQLKTVRGYYGGMTPLEQRRGPRLRVEVRRVVSDFVPVSPPGTLP